jgi:serine/threonine protein kinase
MVMSASDMPFEFSGINPFEDSLVGKDLGSYHIETLLGQGGMGTVYRAKQYSLDRNVALKVLSADLSENDPDAVETFHREALAYAKLRHPGIVTIYESGKVDGVHYLALELIEGMTFSQLKSKRGTIAEDEILDVVSQLASALAAIHSKGLVHRDIKMDNVMVSPSGRVKLMDFGVVRTRVGKGATASNEIAGTFRFMAPEVIKGAPGDARADVFQMGVLIYELLTGNRFNVMTQTYLEDIRNEFFSGTANELRTDVSDGLKDIVLRCLADSPALRFQSATVLERELKSVALADSSYVSSNRGVSSELPDKVFTINWKAVISTIMVAVIVIVAAAFIGGVVYVAWTELSVIIFGKKTSTDSSLNPDSAPVDLTDNSIPQFSEAEVFVVQGCLRGLQVRWDITKIEGLLLRATFRKENGDVEIIEWPVPSMRGEEIVKVNNFTVSKTCNIGWKLMSGNEAVRSGDAIAGFAPLAVRSDMYGLRPVSFIQNNNLYFCGGQSVSVFSYHVLSGFELLNEWICGNSDVAKGLSAVGGQFQEDQDKLFLVSGKGISTTIALDKGKELWQSKPFIGTASSYGACDLSSVYWTSATAAKGILTVVATDNGDVKWSKTWDASYITPPVLWQNHLFFGINSSNDSSEIIRLLPALKSPVWKCSLPERLSGALFIANNSLYCRTKKHILGLRLKSKSKPGIRKITRSEGDQILSTGGPVSGFSFGNDCFQFLEGLKKSKTVVIRTVNLIPEGLSQAKSMAVPPPFTTTIDYFSEVIEDAPGPVVGKNLAAVALDSRLCLYKPDSEGTGSWVYSFTSKIINILESDRWFYVVTEDGTLYKGKLSF